MIDLKPPQVVIEGRPQPNARQRVANAKGLPASLARRLRGSTEAALAEDADRLLGLVREAAGPAPQAAGEDHPRASKHGTILTTLGRDLQANAARTPQRPDRPETTSAAWRTDRGPCQQTRRLIFTRP